MWQVQLLGWVQLHVGCQTQNALLHFGLVIARILGRLPGKCFSQMQSCELDMSAFGNTSRSQAAGLLQLYAATQTMCTSKEAGPYKR